MSIDNIVNVQISRETGAVSRAGFGVPFILGTSKAFTSVAKEYSSQSDVLLDFNSTDPEARSASAIFSQSPQVTKIVIGKRATGDTSVVTVTNAVDSIDYSITINGTTFTVNSGVASTVASIAALLVAAITGVDVSPTDNLDGTFDLDPDVASTPYSVLVGLNQTVAFTVSDTVAGDIASVQEENDSWYGMVLTSRVEADQLAAAAYIETQKKILGLASNDLDIINTTDSADSTTLPAQLKDLGYARTFCTYLGGAATQYPEAAILGVILPLDPGSYTAKFKTLNGITVDNLTTTQETNVAAKNCNFYTEVGGANIVCDGKVSEGEFLDTIVLVDALDSRITENVYGLLKRSAKVPFTDKGIAAVEAEIREALSFFQGEDLGIAVDPPYIVSVPKAADVSAIDKANRTLNNITFKATLTGAIHAVTINGTVSLD